ncbi:biotin-dependent carboxyltransferase family protein [Variovorax defluvii]|uniref:Biotin-dependent carboxyltransferase family protein n=2 Tax=Variovorax defluvii TaxID=913761 RepID=A0ABP8H4T3_9BURK
MNVERPGMLSTLQDSGRFGHQQYGVSVNGPMDEWSHRLANALVGNPENAAVLECTLTGPRLSFSDTTLIALCGARMRVTADGRPIPYHRAVLVRRGVTIDVGERTDGARLYIGVRGGLGTEPVLGSRSTNVRAGFGGFQGRGLKKGDRIPILGVPREMPMLPIERRMVQSGLPMILAGSADVNPPGRTAGVLRFIRGPQWEAFTTKAREDLESTAYEVTAQSDRMGARLMGSALLLRAPLELVSEATPFGTVQVPPDGQPIVLMADRQSAGGYPKIAYVASADLPVLAQSLPGDSLRFIQVSQADAEIAWREFEERLATARESAAAALEQ